MIERVLFVLLLLSICGGAAAQEVRGERAWEEVFGSEVLTASISPDGSYAAFGTRDKGAIYFFDRNGTLLWDHPTGCPVFGSAISENGEYVVQASEKVRVFTREGDLDWQWDPGFFAYSVAISPDGTYIVVGSDNKKVYLLERGKGEIWQNETVDDVLSVSISGDGEYIAAGAGNNVYLFTRNGTLLREQPTAKGIAAVALSPDGRLLASGSQDYRVHLYDRASGDLRWEYAAQNRVHSVSVAADGTVAAGSQDRRVYLFSENGTVLWEETMQATVSGVALAGDSTMLALSTGSGDHCGFLYTLGAPSVEEPIPTAFIETISTTVKPEKTTTEEPGREQVPAAELEEIKEGIPLPALVAGGGVLVGVGAALILLGRRRE
ncbi:hypothetical protein RJ40_00550 [Methanofollis aquaemaris]|uniref:Pyrrolo-quinoline quinone repeat domain-containing protein n=1 Tax=Methanofollis aquaemaris TaxID=126734 RepID=A0A8A3S031_9EURY|nr:PQQ-binding-like beta-propeller repeat protein [Methanofollis aquaemaris]QSZ66097.1 hypothetical protein RJ40_00550 [Methanofollis aquaemaris]